VYASGYLDLKANANGHLISSMYFPLCCYQRTQISRSLACSAFASTSRSYMKSQQSSLSSHTKVRSHILTRTDQNHQLKIHSITASDNGGSDEPSRKMVEWLRDSALLDFVSADQ
jgi:hypothetical protein